MRRIKSKNHNLGTYRANKISLSCFDDKRYILRSGIETFAYGHKDIKMINLDSITNITNSITLKNYSITNKKFQAIIKELLIRCRKLNISLAFITQSYFSVPKDVRLNSRHYLIMKINNKRELQIL